MWVTDDICCMIRRNAAKVCVWGGGIGPGKKAIPEDGQGRGGPKDDIAKGTYQ